MTATLRRLASFRALSLALLAAVAAACDGTSDSHADPHPTTLTGELRAAESGAAEGALRLALAWYPGLMSAGLEPISQPGAIATQDVAYTGTFPQDYVFDVAEAPPAGALSPMPDGWTGKGAIGILLAYQDGNANGALDTIPEDGAPIDHVVGASLEWTASPAFLVVYLTHDQAAASGLKAGFNLLKITDGENTDVVPLTTSIPIAVSEGGPMLDLFVCEAAWDGSSAQAPCGLELDGPVLEAQVQGEIYVSPDVAEAAFALEELVDGESARIGDATVTLDGVAIRFDPESGYYWAFELDTAFAEDGTAELVARRGEQELRRTIAIPAFDFTQVPETVASGAVFDVAWSFPASADSFDVFLSFGDGYSNVIGIDDRSSWSFTPIDHVGEATLSVVAMAGGEIPVTVVRSTTLTFEAAAEVPPTYPYPVPVPFPVPTR